MSHPHGIPGRAALVVVLAALALAAVARQPALSGSSDASCSGDCESEPEVLVSLLQTGVNLHGGLDTAAAHVASVAASATAAAPVARVREVHAAVDGPVPAAKAIPKDVAELTGVKINEAGDMNTFISGLTTNAVTIVACLAMFTVLRQWYPLIYSNNALNGVAPHKPDASYLSWIGASLGTSTDEAADSIGLDNALHLEFCHLGTRIMASLAVPLILVLAPLHFMYGNGTSEHALNRIAMNNVVDGHPWLYYVHAVIVVHVCFVTQGCIYSAQSKFVERRFSWLKALPLPRATTVLVEGIPLPFRSDEKLREFFEQVFSPDQVSDVNVVKHTEDLEALVAARELTMEGLRKSELQWAKANKAEDARPKVLPLALGALGAASPTRLRDFAQLQDLSAMRSQLMSGPVDAIDYYTQQAAKLNEQVAAERARIRQEAATVGGVNSSTAFVTFSGRREAEMAKNIMYTADGHEWMVSVPPEPTSIRWDDLRQDTRMELLYAIVGYAAVVGLYFGFMPICVAITNISYAINLGPLQSMWASLAPTMGLTLFLSFLPTVMLLIFRNFFNLKSAPWAQQKLQVWYFWFQVVFVILVTAVGNDAVTFAKGVANSPFSIFGLLADQLPKATDFYLNYLVLQCSTFAMTMLRYVPLGKFLAFRTLWTEEEARQKAEPEDQDYYGLGSRSVRLTILLLVGLIYSTLCPPIALLTWAALSLYRLCYGYLIVFAETKKPDLGGAFWATMLDHVYAGNILYCVLMTGVLAKRAPNQIPMAVSAASLIYTIWSYAHYQSAFNWQKLAFNEIILNADSISCVDSKERYIQPVLLDDE